MQRLLGGRIGFDVIPLSQTSSHARFRCRIFGTNSSLESPFPMQNACISPSSAVVTRVSKESLAPIPTNAFGHDTVFIRNPRAILEMNLSFINVFKNSGTICPSNANAPPAIPRMRISRCSIFMSSTKRKSALSSLRGPMVASCVAVLQTSGSRTRFGLAHGARRWTQLVES